jgi:hypothetical protein
MDERRRNNRLELMSKIVINRLDGSKKEEIAIEVNDVSKTGVGFQCKEALNIGAVYESYLTIWTKEIIHAFIEIVRIEKVGQAYIYGGIFIGMPEMDASRIEIYETFESHKNNQ